VPCFFRFFDFDDPDAEDDDPSLFFLSFSHFTMPPTTAPIPLTPPLTPPMIAPVSVPESASLSSPSGADVRLIVGVCTGTGADGPSAADVRLIVGVCKGTGAN
jgi:hypothetical protein